jgi:hypothetical protein
MLTRRQLFHTGLVTGWPSSTRLLPHPTEIP